MQYLLLIYGDERRSAARAEGRDDQDERAPTRPTTRR